MKPLVFFICSILSFSVLAAPIKLDLKGAVEYAIEHSPILEVSRREMAITDMQRKNAYSVFLPQLDLEAAHGIDDRDPLLTSSKYSSALSVELTENLYDNGVSLLQYDSAKVTKKIAELNYANDRDELALNIASQFLDFSLEVRLYEVQKVQFDIINKQFNSIANQYKQGIKTRRDFLRFKSELRRSQIQLQNAETRLKNTQADLIKLIASTQDIINNQFEFVAEPVNPIAVNQVPNAKPDLSKHWLFQAAKLRSEIFDNDVSIAKRSYYPGLFLTGGASYGSADYWKTGSSFKDNDYTSLNALLTVKFNLWDWGTRNRNITIAQDRKIQKEKNIEVTLNDFIARNEKLMTNIAQSNSNYLTAQELLSLETDGYAFLESEYRNGRVSYLDLILGLRDLLNAKIQMYTSFYDLRTYLLQYKYHQGQLYETFQ